MITIRRGSVGAAVTQWQALLELEETGVFDEETESATMAWQRVRGLDPDGVVGKDTWGAAGFVSSDHTSDIDDAFFLTLRGIASELGAHPRDMLAVMYSESGCRAAAHNDGPAGAPDDKRYHASGLIQFMPPTLVGLGWKDGHAAFRTLSATDQLAWVARYYRPYRGFLGGVGGLYVATFLPAFVHDAGDPAFVLTATGHGPHKAVLAWAYGPNKVFDVNHDFAITVGELEAAVARNCAGPRWEELVRRLEATDAVTLPELPNPPSEAPVLEEDGGASRRVATLDAAVEAMEDFQRRGE